jgi:acyl carrier protein
MFKLSKIFGVFRARPSSKETPPTLELTKESITQKFLEIVAQITDVPAEEITSDDKFSSDLNLDSIDMVDVELMIQEHFDKHGYKEISKKLEDKISDSETVGAALQAMYTAAGFEQISPNPHHTL